MIPQIKGVKKEINNLKEQIENEDTGWQSSIPIDFLFIE
jgi:hypothetical protein